MTQNYIKLGRIIVLAVFFTFSQILVAQVSVGSGSYTTNFPGTDSAGRNGFPAGTPQLSGEAIGKPVPTNDWWSKLVKEDHADNLFNYPMTMKTINQGLIVTYIPWGVIGDSAPISVGLNGLNATRATVSDYSDWTVTMNWNDGTNEMKATSGIGMPFIYFEKNNSSDVQIEINSGTVTINGALLIIEDATHGADFVVYAPTGSSWSQNGTVYSSSLNGKKYWSMAMLPQSTSNVSAVADEYKEYAFVFPANTSTDWSYNELNGQVITDFIVDTETKEGSNTKILQGLLPHQWANLSSVSASPGGYSYDGVRGEIRTMAGNAFQVENTYKGILPTLPYLANYSEGFSPSELEEKIALIENDGLATWTDSYNEGQVMNRLIQTARIADQTGNVEARDKMIATIKERLEDWLTYQSGEVAFLFYYNSDWSAMLGYPAGHGQDSNINDHHFHWGYFIHAAAFLEQFEPGWANEWGEMINLLVRDAASPNRNDDTFPFLRNFSPYGGHCWANGFASFPQGNDQESTSESMQFNSSLIHWGTITGNDEIRDLGIYLYTTEQTAIEEYWFDMEERNFKPDQQYGLVSRVWGNSYDNGTFWTSDITASYGIELYPMHGGSLYLGQNLDYVQKIWNELQSHTEILNNTSTNPNLWHDTFWKYIAFLDPEKAIELYDAYPNRIMKFGVSDAQTYHWLHAMNAMGNLNATITADYPIAAAFEKDGVKTYVAHNYTSNPISVNFSDGFTLEVPAYEMATNRDVEITGTISSDFNQAFPNGSINLSVNVEGSGATKVEFYDGSKLLGSDTEAPYELKAENLSLGIHGMYAKVYVNDNFNVTNILEIQVGDQVPYLGAIHTIPGEIEAGHFDAYEGGVGQGISYSDVSIVNEGGFRPEEYVDAGTDTNEGTTIGWIAAGEWVEYTIDVETAGNYDLTFRYASGNPDGGGPFHFEVDGKKISEDISVNSTSTSNWSTWASKTVSNIELNKGKQVLRMAFDHGEFNMANMTFAYASPLSYNPPIANAGETISVILPETTATLDGSLSTDEDTPDLSYSWKQIYGPSTVVFNDSEVVSPEISDLVEGIYKFELTVDDGTHISKSKVLVIVSLTGNTPPVVNISSPENNKTYKEGEDILISATASDLDGTIAKVEFYAGENKLGEDTTEPYSFVWSGAEVGSHELTAKAIDDSDLETISEKVVVNVDEVKICSETSTEASEGTFSVGYEVIFETVGTNVTVTFDLLDTDKSGVVAYMFNNTGGNFSESIMDQISGNKFSKNISGLANGETITIACKFAFAGGQSVTKYFNYVVGSDCSGGSDEEGPLNFTATVGDVSSTTVDLVLNATDNSGTVVYDISYQGGSTSVSGGSGIEKTITITGLSNETTYDFTITSKDLAGNTASNNPILLSATTLANSNTSCSGMDSQAQQGSFDIGYNYSFETTGTNVIITFELLDNKEGVVAYLWKENPFGESPMGLVSGKKFTATLTDQTVGSTISYGCKFAFAGGLAVTKYFSYVVGDNCSSEPTDDDGDGVPNNLDLCPNTPSGTTVDSDGCPVIIVEDDDGDGVLNENDLCPNTATGVLVDTNGCEILAADNFTIEVISETCPDRNNGQLIIESMNSNYPFTALLNGGEYDFTGSLLVDELDPGAYEVCVSAENITTETCYNFVIEEGTVVSAKSTTEKSKTQVEIIAGTAPFEVFVNGENILKTMATSFEVDVKHGDQLEVKTAVSCEGSYKEVIQSLDDVKMYPNPTFGPLEISVPVGINEIKIEIYNNGGQLMLNKYFKVVNGRIQVDVSNLAIGVYQLKLDLDQSVILTLIKK